MTEEPVTAAIREMTVWPKAGQRPTWTSSAVHKALVHNFVSLRSAQAGGSVFAFTSTRRQEGVSHVVQSLADGLGRYADAKILVVRFADLMGLESEIRHLEENCEESVSGVSIFVSTRPEGMPFTSAGMQQRAWHALRAKYQYILIDCPALDTGSQILSLGQQIDGTILVVRAGFGSKQEIQQAARLLTLGATRFLGCILNRRTYAVPSWLYNFL